MERGKRDALLGVVFFGTVALLLWATVSLTDLSLGKVPPLTVYFEDAGGIRVGDPVQVRGKRIGKVGELDYIPTRAKYPIRLVLRLEEPVQLRIGYSVQIQDTGVLGSKLVQIHDGDGDAVPPGEELHGVMLGNPLEQVGGFFSGKGVAGEELLGLLRELHSFARNINDPTTSIGAVVRRRELYDELLGSVQSVRRLLQATEAGDGLLGRVIKDSTMREDAMRFLANLRQVSERLTSTEGTVGMMLNDQAFAQRVDQLVANVAAIVSDTKDGQGMLGVLLRDPIAASQFRQAVADAAMILKKANDPQAGALGAILGDPDLARDLKVAIADLREVADKLNSGKGVLGIMINDEELGVRLKRIFTQVTRALEDAREAAPISNFVQVLFGAF
jgi:phospholipid/cholesterol/gamma-HCH transport system substrate-binding protein